MRTKFVRTMTSNHRSTLTNLIRNFDAGKYKLIFDNRQNGIKDNSDNKESKKAVMLDEREAAYRSEVACKLLYFYDYHIQLFPEGEVNSGGYMPRREASRYVSIALHRP